MSRAKLLAITILATLAAILFTASSCSGGLHSTTSTPTPPEVIKPKPTVETVVATTSGMADKYYAILEITVRNDGADGTVIIVGGITQGGQTIENDFPLYITRNAKQVVRLVFPLKWNGGDWAPNVQAHVP